MQSIIRQSKGYVAINTWGQVILSALMAFFIYMQVSGLANQRGQNGGPWGFVFCITFLFALQLMLFFRCNGFPCKVIMDEEPAQLEMHYVFRKPKKVYPADIKGYSKTSIATKAGARYGVMLYLYNGKMVLLSTLSLEDYTLAETFLEKHKLTNLGEQKY
jgi:hypothetical protein